MNRKIVISLLLVIFWMIFIYVMSDMNTDDSNDKSKGIVSSVINKVDELTNITEEVKKNHQTNKFIENSNYVFRKMAHASVYFALAILVFNLLIRIMKKKIYIYDLITVLICFIYACTDEYHQTFIMGRNGSFNDVLIDMIGVFTGCIVVNIIYKLANKHYKDKKIVQ